MKRGFLNKKKKNPQRSEAKKRETQLLVNNKNHSASPLPQCHPSPTPVESTLLSPKRTVKISNNSNSTSSSNGTSSGMKKGFLLQNDGKKRISTAKETNNDPKETINREKDGTAIAKATEKCLVKELDSESKQMKNSKNKKKKLKKYTSSSLLSLEASKTESSLLLSTTAQKIGSDENNHQSHDNKSDRVSILKIVDVDLMKEKKNNFNKDGDGGNSSTSIGPVKNLIMPLHIGNTTKESEDDFHLRVHKTSRLSDRVIEKSANNNNSLEINHPEMNTPSQNYEMNRATTNYDILSEWNTDLALMMTRLKKESKRIKTILRKKDIRQNDENHSEFKPKNQDIMLNSLQNYIEIKGQVQESENGQREGDTTTTSKAMSQSHLYSIWESILETVASYSKDKSINIYTNDDNLIEDKVIKFCLLPPIIQLGLFILRQSPMESGWCTLLDIAVEKSSTADKPQMTVDPISIDSKEKSSESIEKGRRLQLLGAMLLIKIEVHSMLKLSYMVAAASDKINNQDSENKAKDFSHIANMEEHVDLVPLLIQKGLADTTQERIYKKQRTLISTICTDTAFLILEFAASVYKLTLSGSIQEPKEPNNIPSLMWEVIPRIVKLVEFLDLWEQTNDDGRTKDNESDVNKGIGRRKCTLAILRDWSNVIDEANSIYNNVHFVNQNDKIIAKQNAISFLCDEITGVQIHRNHKGEHCNTSSLSSLPLGGICHSLCKEVQGFTNSTSEVLLEALEAASFFVQSKSNLPSTSLSHQGTNTFHEETHILRALCAWLARKKSSWWTSGCKNDKNADEQMKLSQERAIQLCIVLLRSKSKRCTDFVLIVMDRLLTESNVFSDIDEETNVQGETPAIPKSFTTLFEAFKSSDESANKEFTSLEPSQQALSGLLECFIYKKPEILIPFFLEQKCDGNMSVHVLISILSNRSTHTEKVIIGEELCLLVCNRILDLLVSNEFLQKRLKDDPRCLSSLPPSMTIHRLITILENASTTKSTVSTVSIILGDILRICSESSVEVVISCLILAIERISSKAGTNLVVKLASNWRRILLTDELGDKKRYGYILVSIAKEMFKKPSSGAPLEFFGALVDDSKTADDFFEKGNDAIRYAAWVILECALEEIQLVDNDKSKREVLFSRLSPLLLLRRVPFAYSKLLNGENATDELLMNLASIIVQKLVGNKPKDDLHVKTKEERRLLTEIAARYLPISLFFERLCDPVFSKVMKTLQQGSTSKLEVEQSKVAIYSMCNFIPLATNEDCERQIQETLMFALHIINQSNISDDNPIENDIIELQSGCIALFATCLQSYCDRADTPSSKVRPQGQAVIEEIHTSLKSADNSSKYEEGHKTSIMKSLGTVFEIILQLIVTAKLGKYSSWISSNGKNNLPQILSSSARTCLVNSFTLASQRCSLENDSLHQLATLSCPQIVQFIVQTDIRDNYQPKLYIAASLQFLFNILTRTKSLKYLKMTSMTLKDSVRQTYMCAVQIVKMEFATDEREEYTVVSLRMSALKLILVMTCIDQLDHDDFSSGNLQGCLAPGDMAQTFSILKGAANVDVNKEIRQIATHVLSVFSELKGY